MQSECNIHMMTLVRQIFIGLLERTLQYSCISNCVDVLWWAKGLLLDKQETFKCLGCIKARPDLEHFAIALRETERLR